VIVTGSPISAFADALRTLLRDDATLVALCPTIVDHLSGAQRTTYPYLVLGERQDANDGGAMQRPGGRVSIQLDVWSDAKGPYPAQQILSRVRALCERSATFTVDGFTALERSLHCEFETIFDEPDEDSPDRRLYHGLQRWAVEIHET
jgi:hypothetical protein